MRLEFTPPADGEAHTYCWHCQREGVEASIASGRLMHICPACERANPRALVIDPAINWWLDSTREYWHETAGVFVGNGNGEFLFFERIKYPFGLTVPAGHVDANEAHRHTARRELGEEVGIWLKQRQLHFVATSNIRGDKCRRGSDDHRWHVYATRVPHSISIEVNTEGVRPVWLTLDVALTCDLTFATRYVIAHHATAIRRAVQ